MVEIIENDGISFALILRRNIKTEGVKFFSSDDMSLQLGILKHKQGANVKPHIHKPTKKIINNVQEVLHVEYGVVECNFYNDEGGKVKSTILNEGDTILLINGGHGFNILENSKIFEIKQGPYTGVEDDKTYFEVQE